MARSTHGKGCEFYMLSICRLYWSSNQTYLICRWDNFVSTMSPPICYGELFLFFLISMFLAPSKERMKGDVLTLVLSKHTITWFIIWKDEVCSQRAHSMLEKLRKIRQCKSKTTPLKEREKKKKNGGAFHTMFFLVLPRKWWTVIFHFATGFELEICKLDRFHKLTI